MNEKDWDMNCYIVNIVSTSWWFVLGFHEHLPKLKVAKKEDDLLLTFESGRFFHGTMLNKLNKWEIFRRMVSKDIQHPTRNFASVAFRLNFAKTSKRICQKMAKIWGYPDSLENPLELSWTFRDYHHFPGFLTSRLTNISVTSVKSTGARRSGPFATTVDGDRRGSPSVVWRSGALLGLVFLGVLFGPDPSTVVTGRFFFWAFEGPSNIVNWENLGAIRTWEPWNAGILEAVG